MVTDGATPTLAGAGLPGAHRTSRMRREAALNEAAHRQPGQSPRTKGERLPTTANCPRPCLKAAGARSPSTSAGTPWTA